MNQLKTINISKLLLDVDNPRFPTSAENQRDAIAKMLDLQYERIYRLAKDIALRGLDPSENILTYPSEDEPGFYVVAEGNRRVTALKLLLSPKQASTEKAIKAFEKIKITQREDIKSITNCVVFDDEEYTHWVNLKHTGQNSGIGRVEWTAPEKARHQARMGKQSFGNQLFTFIEMNSEKYKEIIEKKKHVRITNISRLFGDMKVRDYFDIKNIDGILYCFQPYERFVEQLEKILNVMIEEDEKGKAVFTVNRIRSQADRVLFIVEQKISSVDIKLEKGWRLIDEKPNTKHDGVKGVGTPSSDDDKGKENKGSENASGVSETEGEARGGKGSLGVTGGEENSGDATTVSGSNSGSSASGIKNPPKIDRNNLIPSYVRLNFKKHKKCARIFNELKTHLAFDNTPNAISILLRIFIDLSLSSYIEDNNLEFKDSGRNPGLHDKVILCAQTLRDKKKITGSQSTAVITYSSQITKSNGSLHQYVHNQHLILSKEAVNTEWDNFEQLLTVIWNE